MSKSIHPLKNDCCLLNQIVALERQRHDPNTTIKKHVRPNLGS